MRDTLDYAAIGSSLGRQLMQGANSYEDARTKMGQMLAQQGAYQAQANLNNVKAADIQRRGQFQTPEYASKVAASIAGLTEPQAAEMSGYMQRGNWGENVEQLPPDVAGPPMATPKSAPSWATPETMRKFNAGRAAHLMNLGATGDSNVDQMTKAVAGLLNQGRIDAAMTDPSKAAQFGRAMAASEGKPLFHQGANGVMDQFTGAETLNAVGKSAAQENLAQAGSAAANAALHRAQIPEVQARTDLTRSKIGQGQMVTMPDGTVITTGAAMPKLTELQGKSQLFGSRAAEADRILSDLEGKYSPLAVNSKLGAEGVWGVGGALGAVGNKLLSTEAQKAEQAQRDFVNAVLRLESGAVINPDEFRNAAKQYFPQPGDSEEVLEQKRNNRQLAIDGLRVMAGPAADRVKPRDGAQQDSKTVLRDAREAIAAGADRSAVIKRLKEMGIKEAGL